MKDNFKKHTAKITCIQHIYDHMYTTQLRYHVYNTSTIICIQHIYDNMYTTQLR